MGYWPKEVGPWTDYTPTVTQNGTRTITIAQAQYVQIGRFVHCWGFLTVTDAGTAGNAISVTLPVAASSGNPPFGLGVVNDGGVFYQCQVDLVGGIMQFTQLTATNQIYMGVSPSFALANGDQISWNVSYRAA